MKHSFTNKNPLSSNKQNLVLIYTNSSQVKNYLKEIARHHPSSRKALNAKKWTAASKKPLSICLPWEKAKLKVRSIHLVPAIDAMENDEKWSEVAVFLARIITANPEESFVMLLDKLPLGERIIALKEIYRSLIYFQYNFSKYKSSTRKKQIPLNLEIFLGTKISNSSYSKALKEEEKINDAISWSRDLVNSPAGNLLPGDFVKAAKRQVSSCKRISTSVLDQSKLKNLGAGAILGVAKGSSAKPYMLVMRYRPQKKSSKRIALIGKGVTFDSGGLSMKSPGAMIEMKCDMAGAAAVAGVFAAIAKLPTARQPKSEIIGIIPLVENMVSGAALRPGDVLKTLSGKTVEVLNTDAEGRLILADALEYSNKFKPTEILDFATLTGACCVALGDYYAGLFCENDKLSKKLLQAANSSGDNLWQLPLGLKPYRSQLNSPIADIKNMGSRYAGASLAALFLREFVPKSSTWAHIDIAGPAYISNDYLHRKKGATGFGIRLMLEYLSA